MSNEVVIGMLSIAVYAGLLMSLLQWMVLSEKYKKYRIRTPETYRIPLSTKVMNIGSNMAFSVLIFVVALTFFHDDLFHDDLFHNDSVSGLTVFGEVLASLLLYDFMYYFMHRIFHHRNLMKYVHGVHHKARFPTSMESLYLNPLENLAGLTLLLTATAVFGPVSAASFLIIVFVHTTANILVHANMILPHPIFKLTNYWAQRHDYHHGKHLNKNFSSIFPFWDMMFGTYQ